MTTLDLEGFWADEAALMLASAPDMVSRARTHLVDLALTEPDLSNTKAVKDHYAACKQIQAYYEGLVKMLRSLSGESGQTAGGADFGDVLREIDAELGALPDFSDAGDDVDDDPCDHGSGDDDTSVTDR